MGIHLRKPKPPEAKAAPPRKIDFSHISGHQQLSEAPDAVAKIMGNGEKHEHEDGSKPETPQS